MAGQRGLWSISDPELGDQLLCGGFVGGGGLANGDVNSRCRSSARIFFPRLNK